MIMTLIEKVVPGVFRKINNNLEILVFRHPLAGIQIVKGTVEHQEQLEYAALRELYEESGIK
ncbi:NUDIX domain-containing protein, partial [Klebsiella pneumoniae]